MITYDLFGEINDKKVYIYTLQDKNLSAEILNYGGIIRSFKIRNKSGKETDVVLGYDRLEDYVNDDKYFGATIGRVCNRIGGGRFTYNGKTFQLTKNDNGNTLHGGKNGFNKKFYDAFIDGDKLVLSSFSQDGEEGFSGNVVFSITFYIKNDGLNIEYKATCDSDSPINLTNHSYFNLDGEGAESVLDTTVYINSNTVTPTDNTLIAKGYKNILNTAFDFTTPKVINKDFFSQDQMLTCCNGYDVNYVLSGSGLRKVAWAFSDKSKILLEVFTNAVGLQFYTGNFLDNEIGKGNSVYKKNGAFCFETQGFPNALNNANYPSIIVKKGKTYTSKTIYKLKII